MEMMNSSIEISLGITVTWAGLDLGLKRPDPFERFSLVAWCGLVYCLGMSMRRWPIFGVMIGTILTGCGDAPLPEESSQTELTTQIEDTTTGEVPVYVGNVIVTNRSDLENLRGYVVIQGNVFINPLMVTDLEPLSSLERIEGTLDIAYDRLQVQSLKSLFGLHRLRAVSGYVQIENCNLLEHLGGLDSLQVVGASLSVYNNDVLGSVDALRNIEVVGMNVNILNNPNLPCYEAEALIENLGENSVGGSVSVQNNGEAVGASCL